MLFQIILKAKGQSFVFQVTSLDESNSDVVDGIMDWLGSLYERRIIESPAFIDMFYEMCISEWMRFIDAPFFL